MSLNRVLKVLETARLRQLYDILGADVERCIEGLRQELDNHGRLDDFWTRAEIRAFFAMVEATTHELRRIVCEAAERGLVELTVAERGALSDVAYDLNDRAVPSSKPRFIPIERHLRFVYRLYSRIFETETELPIGDSGWEAFKKTLAIRNRITHPKDPASLEVTVDEFEILNRATAWYVGCMKDLIDIAGRQLGSEVFLERLRRKFKAQPGV